MVGALTGVATTTIVIIIIIIIIEVCGGCGTPEVQEY